MTLRMVGCSHRQTGVAVRERLAFTPSQIEEALSRWRDRHPQTEAVLLSTCNRVELYTAAEQPENQLSSQNLTAYLAESHALPLEEVRGQVVTLDDTEVARHLFRVAASLDSMVLGEPQIMAQVKDAYDLASRLGSAGPLTHGCFQAALRVARRVAHETALHRHRVSIPSVAVADFASQIFERFDDKRVLVIGAGEMADETVRYLVEAGARQLVILNRDPERAFHLAMRWQGEAAPWTDLLPQLARADLVVSTTAAGAPIVALADFRREVGPRRQQRPLFVLDLAMPRDFDPAISDEIGTYLYSIDDLSSACARNRTAREKEVPRAEAIIADELQRFVADSRHRASAAVLSRLWEELERPKQAELERLFNKLPDLDERQRQEIVKFADRLVNKVMHPPMSSVRDDATEGTHGLLEALGRLFQLHE
jgi:glutamyl-tRNA reductase